MEEKKGYITNIVFRNDENGYTVFDLEIPDGDDITCFGNFPFINEGEFVSLQGEMTVHPVYNEQFKVTSFEVSEPDNEVAILRYLSSGAVKGIRGGLAKRIVDKFGDRTFEVMEHRPEELKAVKGISEKKARDIAADFHERSAMRRAVIFLQKYGISNTLAVKIYKFYGEETFEVLEKNPYRLAEDIPGVGFKKADEIAGKAGFERNSPGRIRAGLMYLLSIASGEGHTYLPEEMLVRTAVEQLVVDEELIRDVIAVMTMDNVLIRRKAEIEAKSPEEGASKTEETKQTEIRIYLPALYYAELNCARILKDLNIAHNGDRIVQDKHIREMEKKAGIELDDNQRTAVFEACNGGVTVITGGPGTGKTTTIQTLIRVLISEGYSILTAAPTGRAAKRMEQATDYPSQTIHRLLECNGVFPDGEDGETGRFGRNEEKPLETDYVIIDEMSMVDIYLFQSLLKALTVETRLVLVGDADQLPSVGPGNVLKDIITSGRFSVVKLDKIFRQARESDIVMNAHHILAGEHIDLKKNDGDFFFAERNTSEEVIKTMLYSIVRSKMAKYFDCEPFDIQVLAPMKKGELGVIRCNELLQNALNPPSPDKTEWPFHDVTFREGDKVMQTKNNYRMPYRVLGYNDVVIDEGTGIYNGDIGVVESIEPHEGQMTVCFDGERHVTYERSDVSDLELAYAITVHKSQGAEYPAVILPMLGGPSTLMTRNILYTAVTRGERCVMIIGSRQAVERMIANASRQTRFSSLAERIREI